MAETEKQQILDKITKLFAMAEGGNAEKASKEISNEAFVALQMARRLLKKHNLDESAIKLQMEEKHEVYIAPQYGKSVIENPHRRANARGTNKRRIWFEKLADVVAEGNYCKIGLIPQQGSVSFYGFDLDREVSIFTFLKLAEIADKLCKIELKKAKATVGAMNIKTGLQNPSTWAGDDSFIESFHQGFRQNIREIYFDEENGDKGNIGVTEFCNKDRNWTYYENPTPIWENDDDPVFIEEFYVNIGKKISERASNRLKLDDGNAGVTDLMKKSIEIDASLPKQVFLVIDDSGSMTWNNKVGQARSGALSFAKDAFSKNYKVGLIKFGSSAKRLCGLIDGENEEFISAINKLDGSSGSTNMADGINNAINYFHPDRSKRVIVVVTDGVPDSESEALNAADNAKRMGIEIMAIGTEDAPKEFLDKLCSRAGLGLLVANSDLEGGIKRMAGMLGA